jgi:hypothetical protein
MNFSTVYFKNAYTSVYQTVVRGGLQAVLEDKALQKL